nr:hypothetical protein [Gemmatimonadaceae bacterium]
DIGVVTMGALKGDALANALMKAVTKAKRRVTFSICGLGTLDETELETIPGTRVPNRQGESDEGKPARPVQATEFRPTPIQGVMVNQGTGEIAPEETLQQVKEQIKRLQRDAEYSREDLALVARELDLPGWGVLTPAAAWAGMTLDQAQALRDDISERIAEAEADPEHPDDVLETMVLNVESRVQGEAGNDRFTNS